MKTLILSITALLYSAAFMSQPTRVAIIDFENISGIAKYDGLGKAMSSMLISDIEANVSPKRLQLVERAQIQKVLKEQNFQATGSVDKTTAVKAGKILGVTYMLVGDVYILNDQLIINARLANTETGDIVFSKKQEGKTTGWLTLKTAIAKDIAASLSMPFTEPTIQDSELAIGTITTFGNAISASDQGNIDKAQSLADAVTEINPEFTYVDDLRKEIEKLKQQVAQNTEDIKKSQEDIKVLNKSGDLVINAKTYEELINNLGSVLITDQQRLSIIRKIFDQFPTQADEKAPSICTNYMFSVIQNSVNKPLQNFINYLLDSSQPKISNQKLYEYWVVYCIRWAFQWKVNMANANDKNISTETIEADFRSIQNTINRITENNTQRAILNFLAIGQSYSLAHSNEVRDAQEDLVWRFYYSMLEELKYPYADVLNSRFQSSNTEIPLFQLYTLSLHTLNQEIEKKSFDFPNFWISEITSRTSFPELSLYENHMKLLNLPIEIKSVSSPNNIGNTFLMRKIIPNETIIRNINILDSINYRYNRILTHYKDSLEKNPCYFNDNYESLLKWSDSTGFHNQLYIASNKWPVGKKIALQPYGHQEIISIVVGASDSLQEYDAIVENEFSKQINTNDFITICKSDNLSNISTSGLVNSLEEFLKKFNNCRDERIRINSITEKFHNLAPPTFKRYTGPGSDQIGPIKLSNQYKANFTHFLQTYQNLIKPFNKFDKQPDTLQFMENINSIYNVWVHEGLNDISQSIFKKGWETLIYKNDPRIAALYFYIFIEVLSFESNLPEDYLNAARINLAHSLMCSCARNGNDLSSWHEAANAYKSVNSKIKFGKEFGKLNRDEMILQDWKDFASRGIIKLDTIKKFNDQFGIISITID